MFIYWGTKERTKVIGNTAYFCKICNDITVFEVSERQEVSHLYLIPMGNYKFIHTELKCSNCSKVLVTALKSSEFNCHIKPNLQELILVQEKLKKEKMQMRKFSIPKFQLTLSEHQLKR